MNKQRIGHFERHTFKCEESGRCLCCGKLTHLVDISLESYICSEQCNVKIWEEASNVEKSRIRCIKNGEINE